MQLRSRAWCWTINNYTSDDIKAVEFMASCSTYTCYGKEVGEDGTPHLQGYCRFRNQKSFVNLKKYLVRAHIEAAVGDFKSNHTYCSKGGDFWEYGLKPREKAENGAVEKARWKQAKDLAVSGKIDMIDADIFVRYYSSLRRIEADYMKTIGDLSDVCGIWLYGPSGFGKSFGARALFPDGYPKMVNKWWDGYRDESVVVLDDVDKKHDFLGHHLKIWADRYSFIAEIKGRSKKIRPDLFIVTSQYRIYDIFPDYETCSALERRFNVIEMTEPHVIPSELNDARVRYLENIERKSLNIEIESLINSL